ncbi:DUF6470 family protein [Brevibacillus daliensis]|uniref:DUF6470 family protein n=1 Tax=Brevibacillus daliensis TaxID=2892995 RepID=UPI001E28A296|nr:DUF6470 family protein [Brevibacillus daliensis]
MQIARLSMTSTPLLLDIKSPRGKQEIEQPRAEQNITQEPAIMDIRQARGRLTMDSSEARENIDLKGPLARTRDNADYGYRQAMEAIADAASEGDRMMAVEKNNNVFSDIGFEKTKFFTGEPFVAAGFMVGDGLEIHYQHEPLSISVQERGAKIDVKVNPPVHIYTPAKVEAYVRQWNRLDIEVVGMNVNLAR